MPKLDKIDRKILLELDTNARESFSKIGQKLGIGKNNVQYHVNQLLKEGVIKKFVVQPSLARLGLFLGKIYFQLSGFTPEEEKEFYAYLQKDQRISWVAKCEGSWDLMIGAYVENMNQFTSVKKDFFNKFERFITNYDIVFLSEGHTSPRTYLINKKGAVLKKVKKFMNEDKVDLSEEEKSIMRFISNYARFNYMDLVKEFKMNIKTAQRRIKDLEKKGVIQGYVTFIDPQKIGYNFFKLCLYLKNYEHEIDRFINYCMELPNVIHVIESLGPWEMELEIETETLQDFYGLTHKIRNDFPELIKKTESVIIVEEKKLDFFPEWFD
ncbi:MAG: Lrp/AsnC family transcriptional regulator [Candidatus Woesearchaeota archaeon]|jgi:DNA-binding Lrp family transcriptional regulator